jgi:hypothetical protein
VDSNAELVGRPGVAHIAGNSEPELAAVGEPGGEGFGNQQAGPPEAGSEDRCLVKNRAGIEDEK